MFIWNTARYVYRRNWNWIRDHYRHKVSLSIRKRINLEVSPWPPPSIISNNLRLSTRMSGRWIKQDFFVLLHPPSEILFHFGKRETFIPYREGTILLASRSYFTSLDRRLWFEVILMRICTRGGQVLEYLVIRNRW